MKYVLLFSHSEARHSDITILGMDSVVKIHVYLTNKTIEPHQAGQHHSLKISSVAFYIESPDRIQPHTE